MAKDVDDEQLGCLENAGSGVVIGLVECRSEVQEGPAGPVDSGCNVFLADEGREKEAALDSQLVERAVPQVSNVESGAGGSIKGAGDQGVVGK